MAATSMKRFGTVIDADSKARSTAWDLTAMRFTRFKQIRLYLMLHVPYYTPLTYCEWLAYPPPYTKKRVKNVVWWYEDAARSTPKKNKIGENVS